MSGTAGLISPDFLAPLWRAQEAALQAPIRPLSFPRFGATFEDRAYQMGVINLSRDSSYRESIALSLDQAMRRAGKMVIDGARIIDVGAESTGVGTARIDEYGQKSLLLPVVQALASEGILTSVDTYLPEVAEAALRCGAGVINLTGRNDDPAFYRMIARAEAGVIICYTPGEHGRSDVAPPGRDELIAAQLDYLRGAVSIAEKAGVERIWVDPGMGVGYYHALPDGPRRIRHQLENTLQAFRFRTLGWPVCVTMASPVAMFGDEVRSAETCFATLAMLAKVNLIRSHEAGRVQPVLDTQDIRLDLP
ncbi:MAG: dihydropteroate synthase [Neomegalonema sp.]|nr:dihydropteroate synthase [Neomegalonema sp.]